MLDPDCIIEFNDGVGEQVLLEIDGMEDGNK